MNRERAEKLLAALIFDDLDETSKTELLTCLQTDDELRERLADMRMAAKVASDTLQHGPDPVLGKRRLKRLARLAGRRRTRPTIFTVRRLAAAAAVVAAVLLPALVILSVSSPKTRLLSEVTPLHRGDVSSKSKYAYDPAGQTRPHFLQPPVTNMLASGDDNLYTMGEADRIVGGQLSVHGGDLSEKLSRRGSVSQDDYFANASGSEPSSGMGISGGGGMMGGYGGGGYGYGMPTSANWGKGIKSSGELRYRHDGIDEETAGGTYSPYVDAVGGVGLDGSTDFGKTISDSAIARPIVTDGHNVTFNDGDLDLVAEMPEGFVSVIGPEPAFPAFPGGGASGPAYRPDWTLQEQGGAEETVAMDIDGEAVFDNFQSRETFGKDYLDAMMVNVGTEAGKLANEKGKPLSVLSGIIQHGLRGEIPEEEVVSSPDEAAKKHDTASTKYGGRPVLTGNGLFLSYGRNEGDNSTDAGEPVKREINGRIPILGDLPVLGEAFRDLEGVRSALPEEQSRRTYGFGYIDSDSGFESETDGMKSKSYLPALPSLEVMKQTGKRYPDSTKAEELGVELKELLPHKPIITVDAITSKSTALSVPSKGETQKAIEATEAGDTLVVESESYNGNIDLVGKEVTAFSLAPDEPGIVGQTITENVSALRKLSPRSESKGPVSQPKGKPVEMEYEIIQLKHADAGEVKDSVADCFGELPGAKSSPRVLIEPLGKKRQIVVFGRKDMREKVKKMVRAIDKERAEVLLDTNEVSPVRTWEDKSDLPAASRFKVVPVNPWVMTGRDALSTFALDVDTASYTLCRRYIRGGFLPPPGAVRMEEFVNYFNYHYPQRANPTFKVYAEAARSPFAGKGKDLTLLKIGVKARTIGRDQRKAAHLIFVVDASASMGQPDRLPLVQKALGLLLDKLSAADRVSLITCADEARLHIEATSAGEREKIRNAIDSIQASGSTNLLAGLKLGYAAARRAFAPKQINHVILCSDGVANVGQTEAEAVLKAVAAERKQGITITCVGVGYGSYNDAFLEGLANRGDGSYVFLDSAGQAQRVFVEQLAATLQTVAKDARIQVDFNPNRVRRYRLIGYENRDIEDKRFRDDTIDAGEVGSGQCSTALYELELIGTPSADRQEDLGTVFVRYRHADTGRIEETSSRLRSSVVRKRTIESAPRFYLAACAARFAEILRQSEHAQDGNLTDVSRVAEQVSLALPLDRDVRELAEQIRKAEHLPASP